MGMDGHSAVVGVGDDGEAPTDTKERKLRLGLGVAVVLACGHVVLREADYVIGNCCTPQIWHQHACSYVEHPISKRMLVETKMGAWMMTGRVPFFYDWHQGRLG
jgi:hypothetical protein